MRRFSVLFSVFLRFFPRESRGNKKRRGRESNPRIEVLQTSALPLGYPAGERISSIAFNRSVSTCKEKESEEVQEIRVRRVSGASGLAGIERLNGVSPRQVERLFSHSELLQLLGLLELLF